MTFGEIGNLISFYLSCIGIVSWALSGTVIALRHKLDVVGVLFIVWTTTFGGGLIRDFTIGKIPPSLFVEPDFLTFFIISCVATAVTLIALNVPPLARFVIHEASGPIINFADALGMAIFCVGGINVALANGQTSLGLLTFCGGITGVGGGIVRDLFLDQVPGIFRKHIYALPAFVGSFLYALAIRYLPAVPVMLAVVILITLVRILAAKFKWNLPALYHDIEKDGK